MKGCCYEIQAVLFTGTYRLNFHEVEYFYKVKRTVGQYVFAANLKIAVGPKFGVNLKFV